ncbi:DUF1826 domain-containing protein [Simiduia curdlanivorans]|uniref:DUF1826 domain-containing protein n=1 Tax=Simiduia curdlanivorans TaxID=1492769 RepID=A0ABV8VAV3_9GAMM|nr:DUF1826 domain-containing protein [Simiduia curdlanivorans]MDN3639327.1 DUF1826 domain-containing protein [Simiduia curdlanivorans]
MSVALSLAVDFHPGALTEIYRADVNIAIWQRQLDPHITHYAQHLMAVAPHWRTRFIQQPEKIAAQLAQELPLASSRQAFIDDVALVVEMFSCLFELEHVGFRMAVLRTAMCPKFHVDQVPCRLISTYAGAGTQWHKHGLVERTAQGVLNLQPHIHSEHLRVGDVALLKGETWEGNCGRGLVHRSPPASDSAPRLVLTLDFA